MSINGLSLAIGVQGLSACYNDDSTLANNTINEIAIKYDGPETLYTGYLDVLELAPTINRGTEADTLGLTYLWEITELPHNSQMQNADWVEIGNNRALHAVMSNPISNIPYTLRLTVTDTENGNLKTFQTWFVYVNSAFLDGILVAEDVDGQNSDLSLILGSQTTLNYNKEDQVYHQIIENATGSPISGKISQLTYNTYGRYFASYTNQIWAAMEDGDMVLFDTKDYSKISQLSEGGIMTYKPAGIKCINSFIAGQYFFLNTNQNLYSVNPTTARNFGWHDAAGSEFTIDNGIIANTTFYNVAYQTLIFYDSVKGAFVYGNIMYNGPQYGTDWTANSYFNPSEMPGYTAIAGGLTTDATTPAMVLKNKTTGEYAIYTFSRYEDGEGYYDDDWNWIETTPEKPQSARMRYDIPEAGRQLLDKAVSVFFAINQSILYIATPDDIYIVNFAGITPSVSATAVFTPNSGERIVKAKMFTQGQYQVEADQIGEGIFAELPWHAKAVIIATEDNDNNGKVSIVPMQQLGTGSLNKSQAKTYDGFGKILDICTVGY